MPATLILRGTTYEVSRQPGADFAALTGPRGGLVWTDRTTEVPLVWMVRRLRKPYRMNGFLAEWGPIGLRVIDDEEFRARVRLRRDVDGTAYIAALDRAGRSVAAQLALTLLRDQDSPDEGSAALLAQVVAGVDGAVGTDADPELPTG